ncbi:MAG TPA: hypothetical protein VLF42_04095 [Burkholderiales bacterium]|nr:hypothetical protein [Burkholderiales bacterium]
MPRNLAIVAFDNGMYHITGRQQTLTAGPVDLVAGAKGAGLERSEPAGVTERDPIRIRSRFMDALAGKQ